MVEAYTIFGAPGAIIKLSCFAFEQKNRVEPRVIVPVVTG